MKSEVKMEGEREGCTKMHQNRNQLVMRKIFFTGKREIYGGVTGNGSTRPGRRPVSRKHDVALVSEQNMQTKNVKCKEFQSFHLYVACWMKCLIQQNKQAAYLKAIKT